MGRRGGAVAGLVAALLVSGIAWAAAPGELDRSFGRGGVAHLEMGGTDRAYSVVVGKGRRIVLVGGSGESTLGEGRFAVARFTPDGEPDRDFSGDGRSYAPFGPDAYGWAGSIDAEHRVVAAGESCAELSELTCEFAVARFTPDGRLDPTFGDDGAVTTPFPGGDAHATAVVARQGKIVVAGVAGGKLTVARYLRDGRLDATFGNGGTTTVNIRKESGPGTAVAVGPRHRVIVASGTGGTGELTVTELRGDGHLRRSFGRMGMARASFRGYAVATSLDLDSRGRIVAAGYDEFRGHSGGRRSAFAVARFGRGGALDDSFSRDGKTETQIKKFDFGLGVAIDSRGRIVVAGHSSGGTCLVRYRPNGRVDRSFSKDGKLRTQVLSTRAVAIDRRDRIVVGGYGYVQRHGHPSGAFEAARFIGYRDG
jgi:uncharacterized delta-60 repeat protein